MVSGVPVLTQFFKQEVFVLSSYVNRFYRSKMPSTMSKMDDEWSVETPPRRFTPKRQKTDPEVKIKLTYPQQEGREDHILHVLFLQTIL